MEGIKHIIECHCVLPQYRNIKNPIYHKFIAFSIIDDSDTVISKFVQCNNCDVIHKIFDICKSEILIGKDEVRTQLTIEDLQHSLPTSLFELLISYNRSLPDFEYAQFIIENEMWNKHIILTREELEDYTQGKLVRFIAIDKFKVESYTLKRTI